jgi:hypothetical protein
MGGRTAPDLKQTRRDPAQGPPDSAMNLLPGTRSENAPGVGRCRSDCAMKLFTGWVMSAGLVFTAAAANAQVLAPYEIGRWPYAVVSDIEGPYAAMPPDTPAPRDGPTLLPPQEVYTVVRDSGFSPLGIPQQRGLVYTIAVIDRGGDDGRLVIDARTGRIIRFIPAYRMGDNFNEDLTVTYGPVGPLPPVSPIRGAPRPPASIPHVASRTPSVPLPKAPPPHAGEVKQMEAKPAAVPAPQSAAVQPKPADVQTAPQAAAPSAVEAKPDAPQILPTQEMPKVQGLD